MKFLRLVNEIKFSQNELRTIRRVLNDNLILKNKKGSLRKLKGVKWSKNKTYITERECWVLLDLIQSYLWTKERKSPKTEQVRKDLKDFLLINSNILT